MADYKTAEYVKPGQTAAFDEIHKLGDITPISGIHRCEGCGREIASNGGNPLPSQNHGQHTLGQGEIRWRLIVWAEMN